MAVCLLAGHIYLGTIGMKGAWEAMRYGYVDETWAKEHHEYWYNDVMAGREPRRTEPRAGRRTSQGRPGGRALAGGGRSPMKTLRALVAAGIVVTTFGVAVAKLPAPPPPTEEQKKAAEEKKAKDAAAAEAAKVSQARAEDRVAAKYFADMKAQGKQVPAAQMPPAAPPPNRRPCRRSRKSRARTRRRKRSGKGAGRSSGGGATRRCFFAKGSGPRWVAALVNHHIDRVLGDAVSD